MFVYTTLPTLKFKELTPKEAEMLGLIFFSPLVNYTSIDPKQLGR